MSKKEKTREAMEMQEIDLDIKNNLLTAMDTLVVTISNKVKLRMEDMIIHPSTIMQVTKYVMEEVENTPLKGEEQKTLAIRTICELVIDAPLRDEKERDCLVMVVSGVIGDTIDLIIDATHGKLSINNTNKNLCCPGKYFKNRRKHRSSNPNF